MFSIILQFYTRYFEKIRVLTDVAKIDRFYQKQTYYSKHAWLIC